MAEDKTSTYITGFEKVPLWRTLFYSLGNAAGLLIYSTFNSFVQYFYTTKMGLAPNWVGRGWLAFGFWNAVNDPIAGWLSDRTSTRWGRRRFFIGLLAIPTAVAFALVWLPPVDASNPNALIVYFLVIISIYDLLQSIVTLNQDALFPEMYQDMGDRAVGSGVRQFVGSLIGNGAAVALTPTIYGNYGWSTLAVLWGIAASSLYLVSLIGIREDPVFAEQNRAASIREQFTVVVTNRTFLIVLFVSLTMRFVLAALVAVMPFYADYVLRITENVLTRLLIVLFVASGISLLGWQHMLKRFGTRTSMILSMSASAVVAVPLLAVNSVNQMAVAMAAFGVAIGGTVLGQDMLFAEVVDDDYVRTGLRREGMYRGILGFIFRFPPALVGLILGEGLAAAGYNADLEVEAQPEMVSTTIRTISAVLPLGAVVVGILFLLAYPLYGERLAKIQRRAASMRQEANEARYQVMQAGTTASPDPLEARILPGD